MSTIINKLSSFFFRTKNYIRRSYQHVKFDIGCIDFAIVIFENCCELLTDLVSDTTLVLKSGNNEAFRMLNRFFEKQGKKFMLRIFQTGYVVMSYDNGILTILDTCDYVTTVKCNKTYYHHINPAFKGKIIVFEGEHYAIYGQSHYGKLKPFMEMLNNILNASNTITKKLGVAVFATPNTPSGANTVSRFNPTNKANLEKEIQKDYGALDFQSIINILSEDLNFQTINLSGQDIRLSEKLKTAVLAISDRIKIPANQIGLIDAQGSKAFANGSEMREGDIQKYRSYERLLDSTFVEFAKEFNLDITYNIYQKPELSINQ